MKAIQITESLLAHELLPKAGEEDVLVMRDGRPIAVISSLDGDLETYEDENDPKFIESIRRARGQAVRGETVSEGELDTLLAETVDGIDLSGFSPPISVSTLQRTKCSGVPPAPGVFVVLCPKRESLNSLMTRSDVGIKRIDPFDPAGFVRERWVEGATIVYIGGAGGREGLKQRICQLVDLGAAKQVGHRGDRLLWILRNYQQLFLRWLETPDDKRKRRGDFWVSPPRQVELRLIQQFRAVRGARPFANVSG